MGALPSSDEVVADCLRAMPFPLTEIPDASDLRAMGIADMRRSRQARSLARAAGFHAEHLTDPDVARALAAWIAAVPRLV